MYLGVSGLCSLERPEGLWVPTGDLLVPRDSDGSCHDTQGLGIMLNLYICLGRKINYGNADPVHPVKTILILTV